MFKKAKFEFQFHAAHSFEYRQSLGERFRRKHPNKVPVIVERGPKAKIGNADVKKYLIPFECTVGHLYFLIRNHLNLQPEVAIILTVGNTVPPASATIGALYMNNHEPDFLLYVTYEDENVYGGGELELGQGRGEKDLPDGHRKDDHFPDDNGPQMPVDDIDEDSSGDSEDSDAYEFEDEVHQHHGDLPVYPPGPQPFPPPFPMPLLSPFSSDLPSLNPTIPAPSSLQINIPLSLISNQSLLYNALNGNSSNIQPGQVNPIPNGHHIYKGHDTGQDESAASQETTISQRYEETVSENNDAESSQSSDNTETDKVAMGGKTDDQLMEQESERSFKGDGAKGGRTFKESSDQGSDDEDQETSKKM